MGRCHSAMMKKTRYSLFVLAAAILCGNALAAPVQAQGIFDSIKSFFKKEEAVQTATDAASKVLSNDDMVAGLKDALRVGATAVVDQLGATDGFWKDEAIRIALPGPLQKVDSTLQRFGLGALTDGVKEKMNRAAEAAVPQAQELFVNAVQEMSIADAASILGGPDDAATQYFRERMGSDLRARMAPIISRTVDDVGVVSAAQDAVKKLPLGGSVPDLEQELTNHVLDGAIDGIFYYLAQEEAAIRENPAKRTTDILKTVFK